MSLRLRLALWYGSLTVLVLLLMSVLTYAVHIRAHYDDLDNALQSNVDHIASKELTLADRATLDTALAEPLVTDVAVHIYDADSERLAASTDDALGPLDPQSLLMESSGRPLSFLTRMAPSFRQVETGQGAFEFVTADDGTRWRVYVQPLAGDSGYLVGLAPLVAIEATISTFRSLVILIAVLGAVATFTVAWLLAGRALRPVVVVTETARTIAQSRRPSERVRVGDRHDELGQLAKTFNQMLESLEQADTLQRRFVGDASHELRAPLTAIQANLELLQQQSSLDGDDQREMVAHANREAKRLSRLVADLLALARADAGLPITNQRVEIDRILLDALRDARQLADGQRMTVECLEPALINGDPDRLTQLVLILLDNALKYTPADGMVSLGLRRQGGQVEIRIRDSGIGIPSVDLPHVFERFYRADPARSRDPGGTGLGLSIARWIVKQHGGSLCLESVVGHGTAATISLPLAN